MSAVCVGVAARRLLVKSGWNMIEALFLVYVVYKMYGIKSDIRLTVDTSAKTSDTILLVGKSRKRAHILMVCGV